MFLCFFNLKFCWSFYSTVRLSSSLDGVFVACQRKKKLRDFFWFLYIVSGHKDTSVMRTSRSVRWLFEIEMRRSCGEAQFYFFDLRSSQKMATTITASRVCLSRSGSDSWFHSCFIDFFFQRCWVALGPHLIETYQRVPKNTTLVLCERCLCSFSSDAELEKHEPHCLFQGPPGDGECTARGLSLLSFFPTHNLKPHHCSLSPGPSLPLQTSCAER